MSVKHDTEKEDEYSQIFFHRFQQILEKQFGIKISERDSWLLQNIFPGRNQGDKVRINISKIYDVHY